MRRQNVTANQSTGSRLARVIVQGLWMLLPVLSLSFLAFVPAVQVWWRARTTGWLITALVLTLCTAGVVTGMALDGDGAGFGALLIGTGLGGLVAAVAGREIVFDYEAHVDPAVRAVLDSRERRRHAREIVAHDVQMAVELGIGRPDLAGEFDDGGMIDVNNVRAADLVRHLGWRQAVADSFVRDRDRRHGYASFTELMAMSGVDVNLLERDAERLVLLPHQDRDRELE
ncbi:hypothetical protein [Jiangella asiatica]|uniref:Helix-hairpin-helix domain-containing protein n=1 Tax=Jiangella asiatica TaxID=2530372 RepID=A0A4R5DEE4_9ACTN|nr:hypothetical protein [Jiangella asiatica]TDE12236.1 hypothetical protein E1269_08120 [Jiangella asiatica]